MMLRLLLILLAQLGALALWGQQAPTFCTTLVPDAKVFDFGRINEADGPVSHTFVLHNTGTSPCVVSDVTAWCGCTTARHDKKPIAPGKSGRLTVTFNPRYRHGSFSKEVVVLLGDGSHYVRLWVKGEVVPMRHPVTDDHPYAYGGGLYMSHRVLPFGRLEVGQTQQLQLRMANDTDRPMTVVLQRRPNYRALSMPDYVLLRPGERRIVIVSYTERRRHAARRSIAIVPRVNGQETAELRVTWLPSK